MNKIENNFVPYEQALVLKELGFDEHCLGYFDPLYKQLVVWEKESTNSSSNWVSSPLYQQAFRWFRENYGLNYEIPYAGKVREYHAFVKGYTYGNNGNSPSVFTYEEAELECLRKLIEICRELKLLNNE